MSEVIIKIDPRNPADYAKFLQCKKLPTYDVRGWDVVTTQDAYNWLFRSANNTPLKVENARLFDYQTAVANKALSRKKYAAWLDCGLGKTGIMLHWAQEVAKVGKVLILCPLSVIGEFYNDAKKFGIASNITNLRETNLKWSDGIGIVNYEYVRDIDTRGVSGIALDESSILKNGEGETKNWLCSLANGIEYRLACSATPSPNDQSEYASHAVFLGICKTNKEFYSRFFRKDGNKYVLKAHGVAPFYQSMSAWACYIQNPSLLGFEYGGYLTDGPEIINEYLSGGEHLTKGTLFSNSASLSDCFPIYNYRKQADTPRFNFVVETANAYKSIVWCKHNEEEANFSKAIENSALITGKTKVEKRVDIINAWREGQINCIVSKPEILGWGVNLQQAEAHVYSGYHHSFEEFYQAIRRSHRQGRQGILKVFLPQISAEMPIVDLLLQKQNTFQADVQQLQEHFRTSFYD